MPEQKEGTGWRIPMAAIRIAAILTGALALSGLIWFGGPLIAIASARPLEGLWSRTGLIVLVVAAAVAASVFDFVKRHRANAAIQEAIAKSGDDQGDAKVL